MVGQAGLEPATPRLSSACSNQLSYRPVIVTGRQWPVGGGKETRTPDILLAKQALYQLSYSPMSKISQRTSPAAKFCQKNKMFLEI